MSKYGGCLVCGQTLNANEGLMCHDCEDAGYMKQTGTKAVYIKMSDAGPVDVTAFIERLIRNVLAGKEEADEQL